MSVRAITVFFFLLLFGLWTALYAQRQRPWYMEENYIEPENANEKTEFVFARLNYPNYGGVGDRIWNMRGNWTIDYPTADRHFVRGVRRLTRVHTRSMEQVVNLETDEVFNWPWMYAVEPGHWELSDA